MFVICTRAHSFCNHPGQLSWARHFGSFLFCFVGLGFFNTEPAWPCLTIPWCIEKLVSILSMTIHCCKCIILGPPQTYGAKPPMCIINCDACIFIKPYGFAGISKEVNTMCRGPLMMHDSRQDFRITNKVKKYQS